MKVPAGSEIAHEPGMLQQAAADHRRIVATPVKPCSFLLNAMTRSMVGCEVENRASLQADLTEA